MINILPEIPLLVDRITDNVNGFTLIAPFDDYPTGGNFETENLPAVFIGDAGGNLNFLSRTAEQLMAENEIFLSFVTPRYAGAFALAATLINATLNAVFFNPDGTRWQPGGYDLPFDAVEIQPAIYHQHFVNRNIIVLSNRGNP